MSTHFDASSTMAAAGDASAPAKVQVPIKAYPLNFTGTGPQYFRVWFVNVLLSILTLGIYTPWARKRTAEYFFSHSVIARSPLEFTASIKRMVIGFFVFVGLYLIFDFATSSTNLLVVGFALGCAAVAIPFLWGSSKRFRVTATRWRGLRLRFGTSWREIYWASWPVFLAAALWFFTYAGIDMIQAFSTQSLIEETRPKTWMGLTQGPWILIVLALLTTWFCVVRVLYNYQRLLVERTYLGIEAGVFRATYGDFIKIWLVTTLIVIAGAVAVVQATGYWLSSQTSFTSWSDWFATEEELLEENEMCTAECSDVDTEWLNDMETEEGGQLDWEAEGEQTASLDDEHMGGGEYESLMYSIVGLVLAMWVAMLTVIQIALGYRDAKQHRLVWNTVGISDIARFRCTLSVAGFVWLRIQNWFLTIVTIGFFRPFARVREYRAKWNSVTVHIRGGVSQVKSLLVIQQEGGAFADAVADFAGFDIVT